MFDIFFWVDIIPREPAFESVEQIIMDLLRVHLLRHQSVPLEGSCHWSGVSLVCFDRRWVLDTKQEQCARNIAFVRFHNRLNDIVLIVGECFLHDLDRVYISYIS